jgi:formate-dependent nitrite reductase membrane component NrfD
VIKVTETSWGILLAAYLFVGGMAGGAFIIAALADLFGRDKYNELAKAGTFASIVSILVGLVLLIFDLGRFRVDPLGVLNAFINFPTSIMTVGTWIISIFTVVALITAVMWIFQGLSIIRKILGIVGLVLGGSTTAYTGLLLAFSRGRPFWNSAFLPWTFVISGTLTGLAISLLLIPLIAIIMPRFSRDFKVLVDDNQRFISVLLDSQRYISVLIVIEIVLVFIEIVTGHLGLLRNFGNLTLLFIVYIVLGLVVPLGIANFSLRTKYIGKEMQVPVSLAGLIFILLGGFLLRYVVLTAGQLIF